MEKTAPEAIMISVVVPVYNGGAFLEELCFRVGNVLESNSFKYEILLVDDVSMDNSLEIAMAISSINKHVKVLSLAHNVGQQAATLLGMRAANGDIVVTIDDDLQNPPEEIPALVNRVIFDRNCDVAIASYDSKKHGIIRNVGTVVLDRLTNAVFGKKEDLHLTSFRAMRAYVAQSVASKNVVRPRVGYLILEVTSRVCNVKVHHEPRRSGKSGYRIFGLFQDMLYAIMDSSDFIYRMISDSIIVMAIAVTVGMGYLIMSVVPNGAFFSIIILLIASLTIQILFALSIRLIGKGLLQLINAAKGATPVVRTNIVCVLNDREEGENERNE